MNRILVLLAFFMLGIMLILGWVQITLVPLANFGMYVLGTWGWLSGILLSVGTAFWLFILYLEHTVKWLTKLGWDSAAKHQGIPIEEAKAVSDEGWTTHGARANLIKNPTYDIPVAKADDSDIWKIKDADGNIKGEVKIESTK